MKRNISYIIMLNSVSTYQRCLPILYVLDQRLGRLHRLNHPTLQPSSERQRWLVHQRTLSSMVNQSSDNVCRQLQVRQYHVRLAKLARALCLCERERCKKWSEIQTTEYRVSGHILKGQRPTDNINKNN